MTKFRSVVTGGNTGIGAAIAQKLISRGHDVVCLSRRKPERSEEHTSEIQSRK